MPTKHARLPLIQLVAELVVELVVVEVVDAHYLTVCILSTLLGGC